MVNHGWMFDRGVGVLFDDGLWMHLIWAIPLLLFIALLGYLVNNPGTTVVWKARRQSKHHRIRNRLFLVGYFKRLPIDTIKIDKSFVGDITTDPDDAGIVTAIIAMAHSLRLKVVAEGGETQEQFDFLLERGCDAMQGYFFRKPLPEKEIFAFLCSTGNFNPA